MVDPWNPTQSEIKEWAYNKKARHEQDWELAISIFENIDLIISLVIDEECPKRWFFLGCLYVFTGDTVRRNGESEINSLKVIIESARMVNNSIIVNWANRSNDLIENVSSYSYDFWGLDSKYVREEKWCFNKSRS